jgi:hypothetical protein
MSGDRDAAHYRLCQFAIQAFERGVTAEDALINLGLTAMQLGFELEEAEQIIRRQYSLCAESETLEQTLQRLAKLGPAAYEQLRENEAKRLHMRRSVLDAEVQKVRAKVAGEQSTSAPIPAWPQLISTCTTTIDGYELLLDISKAIRKFVRLEESQAIIVALWILFTWIFEKFAETNPFLRIVSPEPNCGQSTLLDVLEHLTRAGWLISSSTKSNFVRKVQTGRITFLLDEGDAFLQENEDFRNVLDAANRPNGRTGLSVKQGDDWVSTDINVFVPVAIASIKKLRRMETVEQRSIHIWLKRATKAERKVLTKARLRTLKQTLEPIADRYARWAIDNAGQIIGKEPQLDFEDGRDCDKWEPLVAIADYLDVKLGEWVRQIAASMIGEKGTDNQSIPILLLADIKQLFDIKRDRQHANADKYASQGLCDDLVSLEDRPWRALPSGKGNEPKSITQNRLALMLKDFQIAPHTVRIGSDTPKGFERDDFEDAWTRYLTDAQKHDQDTDDDPNRNNATTLRAQGESPDFQGATIDPCGDLKNGSKPLVDSDCGGVADRNGKKTDALAASTSRTCPLGRNSSIGCQAPDACREAERFIIDGGIPAIHPEPHESCFAPARLHRRADCKNAPR